MCFHSQKPCTCYKSPQSCCQILLNRCFMQVSCKHRPGRTLLSTIQLHLWSTGSGPGQLCLLGAKSISVGSCPTHCIFKVMCTVRRSWHILKKCLGASFWHKGCQTQRALLIPYSVGDAQRQFLQRSSILVIANVYILETKTLTLWWKGSLITLNVSQQQGLQFCPV